MRVLVYPADRTGCGFHRLVWPGEVLREQGYDVTIETPDRRELSIVMDGDDVRAVHLAPGYDVVVFQRITHRWLIGVVRHLRERGVAVVIDVDDDLGAIHPDNPAFSMLHPRTVGKVDPRTGKPHMHAWRHLADGCREATMVVTSTEALALRYGHGHGHVIHNYLADHYYGLTYRNTDVIGWPANLFSHPDDPRAVGNAVRRIVQDGANFVIIGEPKGAGAAFGLDRDPPGQPVDLLDWPRAINLLGVGITPLADTRFNAAKSWLKPLELSAAGVPWIGSPRSEYARFAALGCGVLVDKPKHWYRELTRLRADASLRQELSGRGLDVADKLRLRDHAWRWWEAWDEALQLQRGAAVSNAS